MKSYALKIILIFHMDMYIAWITSSSREATGARSAIYIYLIGD